MTCTFVGVLKCFWPEFFCVDPAAAALWCLHDHALGSTDDNSFRCLLAQRKGSLEELVGSYTRCLWCLDRDVASWPWFSDCLSSASIGHNSSGPARIAHKTDDTPVSRNRGRLGNLSNDYPGRWDSRFLLGNIPEFQCNPLFDGFSLHVDGGLFDGCAHHSSSSNFCHFSRTLYHHHFRGLKRLSNFGGNSFNQYNSWPLIIASSGLFVFQRNR